MAQRDVHLIDEPSEGRRVPPERLAQLRAAIEALGKAQRRLARVQAELVDDFDITADEVLLADGLVAPKPADPGPAG